METEWNKVVVSNGRRLIKMVDRALNSVHDHWVRPSFLRHTRQRMVRYLLMYE